MYISPLYLSCLSLFSEVSLDQYVGQGIGFENAYSRVSLYGALYHPEKNVLPLIDLRWNRLNENNTCYNVDFGVRWIPFCSTFALGVHLLYDFQQVEEFDVGQAGVGFEFFSSFLDIKLCVSSPFQKEKKISTTIFQDFTDGYFAIKNEYSLPMNFSFLDFGRALFQRNNFLLYGTLGEYFISNENFRESFGFKATASLTFYNLLKTEILYTHDKIFDSRVAVRIELSFPLTLNFLKEKCSCLNFDPSLCSDRRYAPFERQGLIPFDKRCCWDWNYDDGL